MPLDSDTLSKPTQQRNSEVDGLAEWFHLQQKNKALMLLPNASAGDKLYTGVSSQVPTGGRTGIDYVESMHLCIVYSVHLDLKNVSRTSVSHVEHLLGRGRSSKKIFLGKLYLPGGKLVSDAANKDVSTTAKCIFSV